MNTGAAAFAPLPAQPLLTRALRDQLAEDYRTAAWRNAPDLPSYVRQRYGVDIGGSYAGFPIRSVFGKASGQLSLNVKQAREDDEARLGFIVLKTVIAQDAEGRQGMGAWARKVTRMQPEIITAANGRKGWTVTWAGRGWHESFEAYLTLMKEAVALGRRSGMVVVPSCKFHLPGPGETAWRLDEYRYTTKALALAWREAGGAGPLILEKDFSPTLAGSDRAKDRDHILKWLAAVPRFIREAAAPAPVRLGVKVMNAAFDDAFQIQMVKTLVTADGAPDFLIYANRLFNPEKTFEGTRGVAYGGPDLSERNIRVLDRLRGLERAGDLPALPPISATGDISSGRLAWEYLRRGCSSCQVHTFFQLPHHVYGLGEGSKSLRAHHELLFHPTEGLVAWLAAAPS